MNTPAPARRSPALQLAGVLLVTLGLPFAALVLWALGSTFPGGGGVDVAVGLVVGVVFALLALAPVALGAWMVERGAPGAWRSLFTAVLTFWRPAPGPAPRTARESVVRAVRWLLTTPAGTCVLLPPIAIVPPMFWRDGWMVSFLAMIVFAALNPVLCVVHPPWWMRTLVSSVVFWVTMAVVGATRGVIGMREGAMVFLVPFMLQPAMVALSGVVRLALWSYARAGHSAPR